MQRPSIIERAFDLARSGRFASVGDIGRQLQRENYEAVLSHLSGTSLRRQLKELIRRAEPETEMPARAMSEGVL